MEQRLDFINTITTQNEGRADKAMALKEINLNMSILTFAGSEATASALSGTIRMLLQNRTAMARPNEEVKASFKAESEVTMASVGLPKYQEM
jgi:cytochrome P450